MSCASCWTTPLTKSFGITTVRKKSETSMLENESLTPQLLIRNEVQNAMISMVQAVKKQNSTSLMSPWWLTTPRCTRTSRLGLGAECLCSRKNDRVSEMFGRAQIRKGRR